MEAAPVTLTAGAAPEESCPDVFLSFSAKFSVSGLWNGVCLKDGGGKAC
jgi:hypothetical protein